MMRIVTIATLLFSVVFAAETEINLNFGGLIPPKDPVAAVRQEALTAFKKLLACFTAHDLQCVDDCFADGALHYFYGNSVAEWKNGKALGAVGQVSDQADDFAAASEFYSQVWTQTTDASFDIILVDDCFMVKQTGENLYSGWALYQQHGTSKGPHNAGQRFSAYTSSNFYYDANEKAFTLIDSYGLVPDNVAVRRDFTGPNDLAPVAKKSLLVNKKK